MSQKIQNTDELQKKFDATTDEAKKKTEHKHTYSFAELTPYKDLETKFLIDELLPCGAVASIIGEDGIGKTQLVTQLCLHICTHQPTFLMLPLQIRHGNALIVATEDGKEQFIKSAWKQLNEIAPGYDPAKLSLFFTEGSNFDSYDDLIKEINDQLEQRKFDLIAIDAFSDLFALIDGEINSNTDARLILKKLQAIAENNDTILLFIHHVPKTKMYEKYKMGKLFIEKGDAQGASAITQKPRTTLALTHDPKSASQDGKEYENYLHVLKANRMGKKYVNNALKLGFDSATLVHSFKENYDIRLYGKDDDAASQAIANSKKGNDGKISYDAHCANMREVFMNIKTMSRETLRLRMKAVYNVGFNKIDEKDGIMQQVLSSQIIKKLGNEYFLDIIPGNNFNDNIPASSPDEPAPF